MRTGSKSSPISSRAHRQRQDSDDVQKELDGLRTWKDTQEQQQTRSAEDQAILGQQSAVKTQLKEFGSEIHDDAERPP